MRVYFNQCDVGVQGTGVLAESVSIQSRNTLQSIYSLGKFGQRGQSPYGGLSSTFQLNYLPELNSEPNRLIAGQVVSLTGEYTGVLLEVGGFSGFGCFLTSYGLEADVNDPVKAQANFITFKPLLGEPANKLGVLSYNASGAVGHGWSVYLTDTGDYLTNLAYNFSYQMRADWFPIYVLGKTEPTGVKLLSCQESISFSRDVPRNILHSGENASGFLSTTGDMRMRNIVFSCSNPSAPVYPEIRIPLSGFQVVGSEISAQLDDFLHIRTTITRGS